MKGSYSLIIKTPEEANIGALGLKNFERCYTVYNGSAFGPGGLKRVLRHFSSDKKLHWHIDHLLNQGRVEAALIFPGKDIECDLSSKMEGLEVEGFGCSDCGCNSHLFEFDSFEDAFSVSELFSDIKVLDSDRYNEYKNSEGDKTVDDLLSDLPDAEAYKEG